MWRARFFGNLTRYNELIWQHIHRIKICMVWKEKLLLASWPAGQTLNELLLIMLWAQLIRSPWVLDVRTAVVPLALWFIAETIIENLDLKIIVLSSWCGFSRVKISGNCERNVFKLCVFLIPSNLTSNPNIAYVSLRLRVQNRRRKWHFPPNLNCSLPA